MRDVRPHSPRTSGRRWRRSCSALLLLGACRTAALPPQLESELPDRARLLRIQDTRRDEPAWLEGKLAAASEEVRALAALTAGRLGDSVHAASLRTLAQGQNPTVAENALFALALLHDTASRGVAVAQLHATPVRARRAAWLLGELGEPARAGIVAALADGTIDARTREDLLLAAARLRPVPVAAVVPWLSSPDSGVAWRAAYALARTRTPGGVRPLLAVAASPLASVREQAARGLAHGAAGDSLATPALEALRTLVGDGDAHVRVNAIRSLSSYGAVARDDVRRALRDGDANVRLTAAQSLDAVMDSSASAWRDAMAADTSFVIQRAVAEGAVKRGLRELVPATWYGSDDWQRHAAAIELEGLGEALGALHRTEEAMARGGDGRERAAAAGVLARLADSASSRAEARVALRAALRDPDVQVRTAAFGGLASGATAGDLDAAMTSYLISLNDRDNDARLAFWQLADSALRRTPGLAGPIGQRGIVAPTEPLERAMAARIPAYKSLGAIPSPARELAWYEQRAREMLSPRPPSAVIETERGTIVVALRPDEAPLTVDNFTTLARAGYFDGQRFHRVVPNFVAQAGDPRGDGNGGPGYAIRDEINPLRYLRGTMGMALSGPNTGGSQFFITHSPQPHLDGGYTIFGQLESGGDVLDRIVQGDRIVRVTIH